MARALSNVLGKTVNHVDVPLAAAKQGILDAGMPGKLTDMMDDLYALGPAGHLAYVADTVKSVTGQAPRSFRQFAQDRAMASKG
ncbi:MAG TPA: hypothetical protein VIM34_05405 [Burkholderiaceae bacterium]